MKTTLLFLTLLLTFFIFSPVAFGQTSTVSEKVMQRKEAVMKRQEIRDEKKKARLEKIEAKMASINTKRTSEWKTQLQKMTTILTKINEKAAKAKKEGKDTTTLDAAITNAQNAISTASVAVGAQAAKQYVVSDATDATVKNAAGETMKTLQTNLRTTHKTVVNAKQAVQNAVKELAKIGSKGEAK